METKMKIEYFDKEYVEKFMYSFIKTGGYIFTDNWDIFYNLTKIYHENFIINKPDIKIVFSRMVPENRIVFCRNIFNDMILPIN